MYLCRDISRQDWLVSQLQVSAGEGVHDGVLQSNGQHGTHYQQRPEDVRHMRDRSEEINL